MSAIHSRPQQDSRRSALEARECFDVSVVIATYRREQLVLDAIRSALDQEGVSTEVIVVDDSGEATARAAVESLADSRVRYIARERNSGRRPGLVRNQGAAAARA